MTFSIVQGDLFDPEFGFDALAQGVNTQGLMGAGIAVAFKDRWPDMFDDYEGRCQQFGPSLGGLVHIWRSELNAFSFVPDGFDSFELEIEFTDVTIYNMFSQIMPGRNGDYRLLQQAAITVLMDAEEMGYESVGLPWIGCGIAGLEKHNVEHIFKGVFGTSEVEFVLVQQDEIHEPVV
jgi:O-acetyl-ADP-ribose deacetylase (regulator of RNase III)